MTTTCSQVPSQDRWNVEALYAAPEDWKKDLQALDWKGLDRYKGHLGDVKQAAAFFALWLSVQRSLEKLHTYAHLRQDEDLGKDEFKSAYGLISRKAHEFALFSSWIEPELLSLKEEVFQKLLNDPLLAPYRFHLEKVGRMRPHTLPAEQEALLALSGQALDTSYKAFGALNNADLTFTPARDSHGKERPLSNATYLSYLRESDRELRKSAFENLHRGFEAHANTICELLQGQIQNHLFTARARKFNSCLDAALFTHKIDPAVYRNLIAEIRKHLPLMHRYIALRKKALKLDQLHVYDLYVPLINHEEKQMSYADAKAAVVDSVAPLGAEYQAALKQGLFEDRWVDVHATPRKRSGAYSSGCYDSMPYILLNYQGTLNDVLTLAHEAGHSMHSYLSRKNQPYIYSQYPIFVAEVASTFNEQLLLKHLHKKAKSPQESAFLTNYQIEGVRATIFRQALFAEFELQLHEWAEQGVPFTPSLLKEHYLKLNRDYYGPDLHLDADLPIEWARIPHFYYNYYVYQYATGLSAALALFSLCMGNEEATARYLKFLSSGGSKYPLDLLKTAGVDMTKPDAIAAAMRHFEEKMKELQKIIG